MPLVVTVVPACWVGHPVKRGPPLAVCEAGEDGAQVEEQRTWEGGPGMQRAQLSWQSNQQCSLRT